MRLKFGGLSNTLSKALVSFDNCYRMENATVERGVLEARPGMRMMHRGALSGEDVCYGFGYGRWGDTERYLLFVKHSTDATATLYSITPGNTATYVAGGGAAGLANSKWSVAQHDQYLYCGNATDGLYQYDLTTGAWKKIATTLASVISPASDIETSRPPYPVRAWDNVPTADTVTKRVDDVRGSGTGVFGSHTISASGDYIYNTISDGSNDHSEYRVWFDVTLSAAQDWKGSRFLSIPVSFDSTFTDTRALEEPLFLGCEDSPFVAPLPWEVWWTDDAAATFGAPWGSTWFKARVAAYATGFNPRSDLRDQRPVQAVLAVDLDASVGASGAAWTSTNLGAVAKIAIGVPIRCGNACSLRVFAPSLGGVWMNKVSASDRITANPAADYGCKDVEYAVVFAKSSEHPTYTTFSGSTLYTVAKEDAYGDPCWSGGMSLGSQVTVTYPSPPGTGGFDRTNVYRRRRSDGDRWYQMVNASSGSTFDDIYVDASDDPVAWPSAVYLDPSVQFGTVEQDILPECMASWKTHLVCGVGGEVYFSRAMNPSQFVLPLRLSSTAGSVDTSDSTQGRTLYMASDQSDTVTAVVAQDALYLVGRRGTYAMVGDSAVSSSPPRLLPKSRGCDNAEAAAPFAGGVLVGSRDGLWWYRANRSSYDSYDTVYESKELTEDVRLSWKYLFETYPDNPLVVSEREGEVWAFRGPRYMRLTKSGRWEEGLLNETSLLSGSTGTDGWDYPTVGSDFPEDSGPGGSDYPDTDDPPVGGGEDDDGSDDTPIVYTCTAVGWTVSTTWSGNTWTDTVDEFGSSSAGPTAITSDATADAASAPSMPTPPAPYRAHAKSIGNLRVTLTRAGTSGYASGKVSIGLICYTQVQKSAGSDAEVCTNNPPSTSAMVLTEVGNSGTATHSKSYAGTLTFSVNVADGATSGYKDIPWELEADAYGLASGGGASADCAVTVSAAATVVSCDTSTNY